MFEEYTINSEKRPVVTKKHCIISDNGLVVTKSSICVDGVHWGYDGIRNELLKPTVLKSLRYGVSLIKYSNRGLVFHNAWSGGYYHWLIEAMPRLLALKEYWGKETLIIPRVLPNPWFMSWLESISQGNHIVMTKKPLVLSGCIYQVNPRKMCDFSKPDINLVSEYFLNEFKYGSKYKSAGLKIYISRKYAGHRKFSNENDVEKFFSGKGYLIVHLEQLTFKEQVQLFMNATHVASIHGAGLANLIFMKPGSKVFEFIQKCDKQLTYGTRRATHLLNPCFKGLSDLRRLDYTTIICQYDPDSTPREVVNKYGTLHGNIKFNKEDVEHICF